MDAKQGMTREVLEQLRAKYSEMLDMRIVHQGGAEVASRARGRMAVLAERFPGALRELDDLPIAVIRDRIAKLEGVLRGEVDVEPWMEAVALFHALARGALCSKRWLEGRKSVDAAIEREYAAAVARMTFSEDARAWAGHLASVARPPGGRVMDLVMTMIAKRLKISEKAVRRLVFGPPRHAARRR